MLTGILPDLSQPRARRMPQDDGGQQHAAGVQADYLDTMIPNEQIRIIVARNHRAMKLQAWASRARCAGGTAGMAWTTNAGFKFQPAPELLR